MRYYESKKEMMRELLIVKTRGSPHKKQVVPFEITGKGMVVQA
jgi:KaiC/GvpD/RAD55 family RecA-like ATPase